MLPSAAVFYNCSILPVCNDQFRDRAGGVRDLVDCLNLVDRKRAEEAADFGAVVERQQEAALEIHRYGFVMASPCFYVSPLTLFLSRPTFGGMEFQEHFPWRLPLPSTR